MLQSVIFENITNSGNFQGEKTAEQAKECVLCLCTLMYI